MRQAVALFDEKDTRDELGIGSIRDAISDALFPGTSVVQTRLRYALFIPWLYARLEHDAGVTSANVEGKARVAETALIGPLGDNQDRIGIVGSRAGRNVQRLPSSVYWLALQRWGVFPQTWSTDDYHRRWDRLRSARVNQRRTDDQGVLPEPIVSWHPEIPPPPDDFPAVASFEVRTEEADFLRGRIVQACGGSLLAHAASPHSLRPDLAAPTPWDAFHGLPPDLAATLGLGRRFAVLARGAALVYNLALARLDVTREELRAKLENELAAWAETAASLGVARQSLDELWIFCLLRANVSARTREFIEAWRALLLIKGYAGATRADESFQLVERRERLLKSSRSRFANPRALETWGGQSGTGLLTYRWGTAQRFLTDLYRGLDQGQS
jgi:uncharacterized protein DUF6361